MSSLLKKPLHVTSTEHGYDFISLYFKTLPEANLFAQRLYKRLHQVGFEHIDMQRKNFAHQPGDPAHFHSDGGADEHWPGAHSHFHVIYPHRPTEADWEYLYQYANAKHLNLNFSRDLPTRYVQENNNDQ